MFTIIWGNQAEEKDSWTLWNFNFQSSVPYVMETNQNYSLAGYTSTIEVMVGWTKRRRRKRFIRLGPWWNSGWVVSFHLCSWSKGSLKLLDLTDRVALFDNRSWMPPSNQASWLRAGVGWDLAASLLVSGERNTLIWVSSVLHKVLHYLKMKKKVLGQSGSFKVFYVSGTSVLQHAGAHWSHHHEMRNHRFVFAEVPGLKLGRCLLPILFLEVWRNLQSWMLFTVDIARENIEDLRWCMLMIEMKIIWSKIFIVPR